MDDCIFCKIINGQIPSHKVYENDFTYAFLDINPLSKGHLMVIPKHHYQYLHELPENQAAELAKALVKIASAVAKFTKCNYNVLNNNGAEAGQVVNHVHFHIIPKDGENGIPHTWNLLKEKPDFEAIKNGILENLK